MKQIGRPLEREIQNHWQNYYAKGDDALYKKIYHSLIVKVEWQLIEYNFLCWLNYAKNYDVKFNAPTEPRIQEQSVNEFQSIYVTTERRLWLYTILVDFVKELKTRFKLEQVEVLIGGSFSDLELKEPNDIDLIVLTEPNADTTLHESYLYAAGVVPDKIDVKFLPKDYSVKVFKAYSNIFTIGNKVEEKNDLISNNQYTPRVVLKLRF